ncbi:MAG: SDR family oxidoreductase [Alphaproteobacteria bacterium]|nr:SDR family oxidoreductase [Alphaproteobacteria bacterium]
MDLGIEGLRVLVTAGAGGIGLYTTQAFLREGARVHVCDIDREALDNLATAAPGATGTFCDVSNREQVARMMDETIRQLGGLDCLVNNAGIAGPTGRVDEIAPEEWDQCLDICISGQFNVARVAVPHLKSSTNPSIINYSSAAGKFGFPLRSPYAAAKWGVIGFTKTLAMELGGNGIRCNAIQPGPVDGARIRSVIDAKARASNISFEEMQQRMLANQSIKRLVPPEQLANLTVYIASPLASLISGQELAVDGDMQGLA